MFSLVLMHVVIPPHTHTLAAPGHLLHLHYTAEKRWKWSLSGTKVQRRGLMCSTGLAVWLPIYTRDMCLKQRGWEKEQCQPSLVSHHPAGSRASEHKWGQPWALICHKTQKVQRCLTAEHKINIVRAVMFMFPTDLMHAKSSTVLINNY